MYGPRAPWTPAQWGLSQATLLGGCYLTGHDPSPAHAGGRGTPDKVFPQHIHHLKARYPRDRGLCLATLPFRQRGNPAL